MATARLQLPADDSVLLRIAHYNISSFAADVRFSLQTAVKSVKEKLWRKSGTSVESMKLELYNDMGERVGRLDDNSRPLGFYSPHNGCLLDDCLPPEKYSHVYHLHIIDLDPSSVTSGGWLEDTSVVEKYTISDEAYNKLDGTLRKFKEKLASQNPTILESKIGDRCEVKPGGKRGVIKFVGKAETVAPGFWVGIHYDEPLGKHDGTVKGKRYFECPPRHGALLRPDKVKVGDFPDQDPFDDDEI